jgi:putative salt-induced outer membrane protein YdiY
MHTHQLLKWTANLAVAFSTLLFATSARAADPAPAAATPAPAAEPKKEEPKKWESVLALGVSLTRGNSKNLLATGTLNTTRKWEHDTLLLGVNAGYGEATTEVGNQENTHTTDNYVKGFGQFNHNFTDRFYGGLRVAGDHDQVANLNYRATVSPLLGYYLLKSTNYFLSAEAGPSYINEKFKDEATHSYWAARAAERGEYTFKSGAKLWEGLEYLPRVDELGDYIINAEAGISAPVSKALDVRLIVQWSYVSQPAEDRLKNDVKLIGALGYHF